MSQSKIVKPLRNGQITIPAEFRQRLGITADSVLQVILAEGELRIRPLEVSRRAAGSPWLKELYDLFAPVREEAKQFSEAEIDAAVDSAVRSVRRKNA
jgi:AbrB family looped-hinge helix DNA binding protein